MLFDNVNLTILIVAALLLLAMLDRLFQNRNLSRVLLFFASLIVLSQMLTFTTILVLVVVASLVYGAGRRFNSTERNSGAELTLAVSLVVVAFVAIKYDWGRELVARTRFTELSAAAGILQTVGMSYLLFRCIHFLVDGHRKKLGTPSFVTFLNYVFFFPTFLAGPIERYQRFARWSDRSGTATRRLLFLPGIAKILIAVMKRFLLVPLVAPYALDIERVQWTTAYPIKTAISLIAYSFYLYLDFSALSDLAIGTACLLGFKVMENFNLPYLAPNISEFWRRWHMSLSSILREYLFKPIVQRLSTRLGPALAAVTSITGYLLTFVLCGVWHGSGLNFVLWGLWHGVGLSIWSLWRRTSAAATLRNLTSPVPRALVQLVAVSGTFLFVSAGWLFFAYPVPQLELIVHRVYNSDYKLPVAPPGAGEMPQDFAVVLRNAHRGGGWGISVQFKPTHPDTTIEIEYAKLPEQAFRRLVRGPYYYYGAPELHGKVAFGDSSTNVEPGEYLVRMRYVLRGDKPQPWLARHLSVPEYR